MNFGVGTSTFGMVNPRLFDDGTPYAGDAIPVKRDSEPPVRLPNNISGIFGGVSDAYSVGGSDAAKDGDIRIVAVEQPDGSKAYIVNIPGTENWGAMGGGNSRDLTSNFLLTAGQSTSASQSVALAMERAGIPADAPVMLVGHSQGGMIAASLASDDSFMSKYNVTNVVTAGSPLDNDSIHPQVDVIGAQHSGDVVPKTDLGGLDTWGRMNETPSNVSLVTMANPPRDTLGNILHYGPSSAG